MKIEVWSDIACPFCYIGKHHLEKALEKFPKRDEVQVSWRSFELDPHAKIDPDGDIYELLAAKYDQSREWAVRANEEIRRRAAKAGLEFKPEKIISTNTFDAHRLIKLAGEYDRSGEAWEQFFKAYFSEGKHIADHETLREVGSILGLPANEVEDLLKGKAFSDDVRADEREAQQLGIRGVPFFLFEHKYAVSGAQPVESFLDALGKVYKEKHDQVRKA